jgi:HK97 family phage prohead protease
MDRIEVKLASDDFDAKTGEFAGYGAIFGNLDSYGDVIAKGAFKSTLREWEERGKLPPMLLQHGGGGFGGSADDMLPVGQWTQMEENSKGLKVAGKLFALGTERGQYLYEGMKSGVLDGLSIGFRARKFTRGTKPTEPVRTLEDVDLMEVSIVTFPANGKARVSNVKSYDARFWRAFEAKLVADPELNLSSAKAVSVVAILKKHLREEGDEPPDLSREVDSKALADAVRRLNLNLLGVS